MKVLDFGLAKALEEDSFGPRSGFAYALDGDDPGGHDSGHRGLYVSGQAEGRPADRRADIWAFGVVLFEMLEGQQTSPAIRRRNSGVVLKEPIRSSGFRKTRRRRYGSCSRGVCIAM